jgi:hypothetical protein
MQVISGFQKVNDELLKYNDRDDYIKNALHQHQIQSAK